MLLAFLGGHEVYTLSLVGRVDHKSVALANELGEDTKYLRTTLHDSLTEVINANKNYPGRYFIFEMANIYLKRPSDLGLPDEKMTLAGFFVDYKYRLAKGIIESVLDKLNILWLEVPSDEKFFQAGRHITFLSGKNKLGDFGISKNANSLYFEFDVQALFNAYTPYKSFKKPSKFPPQIEDLTLSVPNGLYLSQIIDTIKLGHKSVQGVKLLDVYNDNLTFRIFYHDEGKTLTDNEVAKIRAVVIKSLQKKFGVKVI
jgi:phenylalanyl-tRNA synthetase beta subunit